MRLQRFRHNLVTKEQQQQHWQFAPSVGTAVRSAMVRGFHVGFMLHGTSATTEVAAFLMSPVGKTWDS